MDENLYDLSINLMDTQSDEPELQRIGTLCKTVFLLLEDDNKEIISELSQVDDNVGVIRNIEIENQKNKLSPEDFEIWMSEHNQSDSFTENTF